MLGSSPYRSRTARDAMKRTVFVLLVVTVVGGGSVELVNPRPRESQNRTAGQMVCREDEEYSHNGFCCKNCEAGTYVSGKCSADQQKGTCQPCEHGTYAEHPTGMEQCLQCSQCHLDQVRTAACTSVKNTQCECKPGFFCRPNEPCEVCTRCSRCRGDEVEAQACTPTSNTKCRKHSTLASEPTEKTVASPTHLPTPENGSTWIIVPVVLLSVLVVIAVGVLLWKQKKCLCETEASPVAPDDEVKIPIDGVCVSSAEEQENSRNAGLEAVEELRPESRPLLQETQGKSMPVEDEDRGLGDSLPNTTSSSQTSLSALPVMVPPMVESPPQSPPTQRQACTGLQDPEPWAKDDGPPRRLVPLQGEEVSLSKSFDLFDVLDVRVHNKFFRSIGVSDNAIRQAEALHAADKVYELLRGWMQHKGLRASINDLLDALLQLDQRWSAEQIASKAVERGYYKYE
ncbi:tumor necrosis factor receptor superfamily, member a [Electrophorus electricus]|uniref:Tumor necrosis factor receptor superfamily, member a n=1 Tax=Electrophorus electricus TaxID=8005 RepID=A0A4W4EQG8_ELEEL|nr:tumor necrosis factor receptor superfamily, member a [Electrophorus electricus]